MSANVGTVRGLLLSNFIVRSPGNPIAELDRFSVSPGALHDEQSLQADLLESRRLLWALLDQNTFCEALSSLNPDALINIGKRKNEFDPSSRRNSRVRLAERTLLNVLIRICSRNDTTGLAGSLLPGTFDPQLSQSVELRFHPEKGRIPFYYFSHGHLTTLLRHLDVHFLRQLRQGSPTLPTRSVELSPNVTVKNTQVLSAYDQTVLLNYDDPLFSDVRKYAEKNQIILISPDMEREVQLKFYQLLSRGILALPPLYPQFQPIDLDALSNQLRQSAGGDEFYLSADRFVQTASRVLKDCNSLSPSERASAIQALQGDFESLFPVFRSLQESDVIRHVISTTRYWDSLRFFSAVSLDAETLSPEVRKVLSSFDGRPLREIQAGLSFDDDTFADLLLKILDLSLIQPVKMAPDFSTANLSRHVLAQLEAHRSDDIVSLVAEHLSGSQTALLIASQSVGVRRKKSAWDRVCIVSDSYYKDAKCRIGGELLGTIQNSMSELLRLAAFRHYSLCNSRELSNQILGEKTEMPLGEYLTKYRALYSFADVNWVSRLDIEWQTTDSVLHIKNIKYPSHFLEWLERKVVISNPDLMLAQSDGQGPQLLLNELHAGTGGMPVTNRFEYVFPHSDSLDRITDPVSQLFLSFNAIVFPDIVDASKGYFGCSFLLRQLAFVQDQHLWRHSGGTQAIPIGRLLIRRIGDSIAVTDGHSQFEPLTFLESTFVIVGDSPSGLGVEIADQLLGTQIKNRPQVNLGDLILSRHRITVTISDFLDVNQEGLALLAGATQMRQQCGLPRYFFVRFPKEKPFLVDSDNLLSLESLRDRVKGPESPAASISPMQPDLANLWLATPDGTKYCSELRFTAARVGTSVKLPKTPDTGAMSR